MDFRIFVSFYFLGIRSILNYNKFNKVDLQLVFVEDVYIFKSSEYYFDILEFFSIIRVFDVIVKYSIFYYE